MGFHVVPCRAELEREVAILVGRKMGQPAERALESAQALVQLTWGEPAFNNASAVAALLDSKERIDAACAAAVSRAKAMQAAAISLTCPRPAV